MNSSRNTSDNFQEKLQEIMESVDIAEYISQYVDLKKSGASYKGLCPFHDERTPSFYVTPEKKLYHCFGCGAAGNVIGFAMKYNNLDFIDALKMLCERYNIVFEQQQRPKYYNDIIEIHKDLLVYSKDVFYSSKGKKASEYMKKRDFSKKVLENFEVGYFPEKFDLSFFKRKYSKTSLLASGLFYEYSSSLHFKFAGRLSIPIRDNMGNVVAFSGRALDDNIKPKYINSPTTDIFEKRKLLYNMYQAKGAMKKEGTALVVEGYFDVMRCSEAGIKNVVSPMGTSFTKNQASLLKRYCDDVLLVFDGDIAGKKAAFRSLDVFLEINFSPQVVFLPEHDDPDSFIKGKGKSNFLKLLSGRDDLFVSYAKNLSRYATTYQKKVKILDKLKKILMKINNPYLKDEYFSQISKIFQINEETFRKDVEFSSLRNIIKKSGSNKKRLTYLCEENFLACLFKLPEDVIDSLLEDLNEHYFNDENSKKIYKKIVDVLQNGDIMHVLLNDSEVGEIISHILINDFGEEDPYQVAIKNKKQLRYNYLHKIKRTKIDELNRFKNDPVKTEELLSSLNNILSELKNLKSSVLEV